MTTVTNENEEIKETVEITNEEEIITEHNDNPDNIGDGEESGEEVCEDTTEPPVNLSEEEMVNLANYMAMESGKNRIIDDIHKYDKLGNELKQSFTDDEKIDAIIDEKLSKYDTVEELAKFLADDKNVKEFYTDDNGEEIGIIIDFKTEAEKLQFMRESLLLFKTIDVAHTNMDIEFDKLDAATKELSEGLKDACYQISDNVLAYTGYLRDKAVLCEDKALRDKILRNAKYIESAYNFEIYAEVFDKHPSVPSNTRKELEAYAVQKVSKVESIGGKYIKHLNDNKVAASLIAFTSAEVDNVKSFEERFLIAEQYEVKDLFVYSIIRFFAMANWNEDIKMAHSSICLMLTKMYNNSLDKELQGTVITNIVEYLKRFN